MGIVEVETTRHRRIYCAGIACIALAGAGIGIGTIFGNFLSGALRIRGGTKPIPELAFWALLLANRSFWSDYRVYSVYCQSTMAQLKENSAVALPACRSQTPAHSPVLCRQCVSRFIWS